MLNIIKQKIKKFFLLLLNQQKTTTIMLFRFLILSDEVDDFKREIKIDSEATFLDLHNAILDSVGYTKDQMCSFFICEDDWSKKTEITLVEMDTASEEDNYIMEDTRLEELLEDEHQKLLYVFDYMTERAFFMELREIIPGKDMDKPECSISLGNPRFRLCLLMILHLKQVEHRI
mgnify:CR=1 FL=1